MSNIIFKGFVYEAANRVMSGISSKAPTFNDVKSETLRKEGRNVFASPEDIANFKTDKRLLAKFLYLSKDWISGAASGLARKYNRANADEWESLLTDGIWTAISRKRNVRTPEATEDEEAAKEEGLNPNQLTVPLIYFEAKLEALREYKKRYMTTKKTAESPLESLATEQRKWPSWLFSVINAQLKQDSITSNDNGPLNKKAYLVANKTLEAGYPDLIKSNPPNIGNTVGNEEAKVKFNEFYSDTFVPTIASKLAIKTKTNESDWVEYLTNVITDAESKEEPSKENQRYKHADSGLASLDAPANSDDPNSTIDAIDTGDTPLDDLNKTSNVEQLKNRLSPFDFALLKLKMEDYTLDEIANSLGVSKQTVNDKFNKILTNNKDFFKKLIGPEEVKELFNYADDYANKGGKNKVASVNALREMVDDALLECFTGGMKHIIIEGNYSNIRFY